MGDMDTSLWNIENSFDFCHNYMIAHNSSRCGGRELFCHKQSDRITQLYNHRLPNQGSVHWFKSAVDNSIRVFAFDNKRCKMSTQNISFKLHIR